MSIRLTTADSPADPAMHGVLAAVVSMILGVAAHGFGGGLTTHGPATSHVLILGGLAVIVGVVRAGQVHSTERRRSRGAVAVGWVGTAGALVGGQAAAHIALSMLGHGPMMPDAPMMLWHALALPAAVGVLVVAERLARACRRRITVVQRLVTGAERVDTIGPVTAPPAVQYAYRLLLASAAGVRGPPATV